MDIPRTHTATAHNKILSDISFEHAEGEILGIIGNNGCGKSTLLRIIAGILKPDTGQVVSSGKIIPLIHLDSGVKARLTMRENIFLAGTLLGMTWRQISNVFDDIVAYSELGSFVDTKWYKFSDGMKQKVVFSIGLHAEPDIFLLDEAFSAGDEAFRVKSIKAIRDTAKKGASILMVGHNLATMEELCQRILWIDSGKIKLQGDPSKVVDAYRAYAK